MKQEIIIETKVQYEQILVKIYIDLVEIQGRNIHVEDTLLNSL